MGTGRKRILIDTAEGRDSWPIALQEVLIREKATVEQAVISHWHHDHVGGINQLQKCCPGVKIYKHKPDHGQLNIEDGQLFKVEGATLRLVYCPGHTEDHMAMVLEEEDAMFTADNVLGHGTAVFENLAKYMASLDKMRYEFTGRAYPGHGQVIEDGRSKILEYIQHRRQREEQVLQVLSSSNSSTTAESGANESDTWKSMEIVKFIYKDVPESLHLPANGGVVQILKKLEEEGRAAQVSNGSWSINNRAAL